MIEHVHEHIVSELQAERENRHGIRGHGGRVQPDRTRHQLECGEQRKFSLQSFVCSAGYLSDLARGDGCCKRVLREGSPCWQEDALSLAPRPDQIGRAHV